MTKRKHGSEPILAKMAFFLIMVILLSVLPVSSQDLASDTQALLAFGTLHDPNGLKLNWTNLTSACTWLGITCGNNRVIELRLPGKGLRGVIPPGSLSNITELQVVSLRGNKLTGDFPDDFAGCRNLRQLYLAGNDFYGSLPNLSAVWPGLTSLSLDFNRLNGTLPESLQLLSELTLLTLRNNSFSGSIPPLNLSNLTVFDVAYNNLSGTIPAIFSRFTADSFIGNLGLCGAPLGVLCTPSVAAPLSSSPKHHGLSKGAIAGIVVGGVAFLVLVVGCFLCLCAREDERDDSPSPSAPGDVVGASRDKNRERRAVEQYGEEYAIAVAGEPVGASKLVSFSLVSFDLEDLLRASAEVLGKGSVGTAYKAILEDGTVMAVKRLKDVTTGKKEFEALIQAVGKLQHRNVVPVRAYYYSKDEKLLVSDFMPMGSLAAILHGNRGPNRIPVDWLARVRIAIGAAKGLAHLHAQGGPNFVHGNIKSSNILLNRDREACVADFGLSPLMVSSNSASKVVGYRAPEVAVTRKLTHKSDIYSFGVLLLELLTGKAPIQPSANSEAIDLPRWVQSTVREEWTAEVFDLELMRYPNVEGEMVSMLKVAMQCVDAMPEKRPKMSAVLALLEDVHPFFIVNGAGSARPSVSAAAEMIRGDVERDASLRDAPSVSRSP